MSGSESGSAAETFARSESLGESRSFIQALLAAMPSPAIVVSRDRRIVLANRAFARAAGADEASVVGMRTGEVLGCTNPPGTCATCADTGGCVGCSFAQAAFQSAAPIRTPAQLDLVTSEQVTPLDIGISAQTFSFKDETLALVIFHDLHPLLSIRRPERRAAGLHGIIGRHESMQKLFETIRRVGPSNLPVLIQGESGTGKEMIALAIHRESGRAQRPMVSVNSAALPEGVLESELFGHVRGAFTGAVRDKRGRFEIANNGTLFLDEIGEIPPPMQVRLLRVLQEGTFERVGGEQTIRVDVRLVCATNRNLEADVDHNRFRADLFYRISVVPITVPPLRARRSDIPLLVAHFVERAARECERPIPEIAPETMEILVRHLWPGNVRELENVLRFGIVYAHGGVLLPHHLPARILTEVAGQASRSKLDRDRVTNALAATGGNKRRAAALLGVSRATLYRFLEDAGFRFGDAR